MTQTGNAVRKQSSSIGNRLESLFTNLQVSLYRLSGGSVAGTFQGVPVLLLTTTGRKTGKKRTKPLLYLADNDQVVLVASHGGTPTDPSWWRNLLVLSRFIGDLCRGSSPMHHYCSWL